MPRIKNISQQVKMVADRYLQPGESRNITAKQATMFRDDLSFEIADEGKSSGELLAVSDQPEVTVLKVQIVDKEPLQTKPEVAPETGQGDPAPTLPAKVRKPRGKKK